MMKFTIINFRGIAQETIALEHMNMFVGKNGKGKSSALMAIAFALTGKIREKDIRNGEDNTSVRVEFSDGDVFERKAQRSGKIPKSCFINGKKCQNKVADQFMEKKFGCSKETLNALLTEDLLDGNIGEALFNIIPVQCSHDRLLDFVSEFKGFKLTDKEIEVLNNFFKDTDKISFSDIDLLYKEMYAIRREKKALLKNVKSRASFDPKRTLDLAPEDILRQKRDDLLKQDGAYKEILKQLADYKRLSDAREKAVKEKEILESRLNSLPNILCPDPKTAEKLNEEKNKFQRVILYNQKNMATLENNNQMLASVLAKLKSSSCPIHPSIKCSTDKSEFQSDIEKQVEENQKNIEDIADYISKCQEQIKKRDQLLEKYQSDQLLYQQREMLSEQLKSFIVPELPKKPEMIEERNLSREIAEIEKQINIWTEYRLAMKAKKEADKLESEVAMYELLTKASAPNGVKTIMLKNVLLPLEDECNNLASKVGPNLSLKFSIDSGKLDVLAKFHDEYVDSDVLSSGEKVIVLYLIMELIHKITNAKIMQIDNLDRLDKENIQKLFDLLESSKSFYWLLFGSVDHNDTIETIAGRNVQAIEMS